MNRHLVMPRAGCVRSSMHRYLLPLRAPPDGRLDVPSLFWLEFLLAFGGSPRKVDDWSFSPPLRSRRRMWTSLAILAWPLERMTPFSGL